MQYIAEKGRTTFYYVTGKVVSAEEDRFCNAVIEDESNVKTKFPTVTCWFEMKDFQSTCSMPEVNDVVRITCNRNMTVLIGIYINADELSSLE